MKKVEIYTDGACSGNPGAGGWAAILSYNGHVKEISGGEKETTNNRMELTAIIKGLDALTEICEVEIFSDSQYAVSAFTEGWVENWVQNGFKGADKKPVKNSDLWQILLSLTEKHKVTFNKVKGHADDEKNNRCDSLARAEIDKIKH